MMKIYFVRHGKTEWNREKRLQGQCGDSLLLDESYHELARVKKYLSNVEFDRVFSSPQKRAVVTAEHITEQQIEQDERLSEWNFGKVEGMKIEDASRLYPQEMWTSRYRLDQFDGSIFGAEKVSSVLERFDSLVKDCQTMNPEGTYLWVGHGASGTAGIRHLLGFPIAELRAIGGLKNNSLTILEGAIGHFNLKEWNLLP